MSVLDKIIIKSVSRAIKKVREDEPKNLIVSLKKEITKPYPAFAAYNINHEVRVVIPEVEGITVEMLNDVQHKHNIPAHATLQVYQSDDPYGSVRRQAVVTFEWPDANNLDKKEEK